MSSMESLSAPGLIGPGEAFVEVGALADRARTAPSEAGRDAARSHGARQPDREGQDRHGDRPARHNVDYLDVLRTVATFAVVMCHVSERVIDGLDPVGPIGWWTANFLQAATRVAVPLFIMISGALLLDPSRDESTGYFLRRRAGRILIPMVFWTACYTALWAAAARAGLSEFAHPFTLPEFLKVMALGTPWYHLWFLYMIPGLYLFTPALRAFVRSASPELQWHTSIAIFAVAGVYSVLSILFLGPQQIAWVAFIPYIAYFLAGYRMHSDRATHAWHWKWGAAMIAAPLAMGLLSAGLVSWSGEDVFRQAVFNYLCPLVVVMSIPAFAFMAGRHLHGGRFVTFCRRFAPATFGIYLIHPLVMSACRRVLGLDGATGGAFLGIVLSTVVVCLVSYLAVSVILKTPYLRRVC